MDDLLYFQDDAGNQIGLILKGKAMRYWLHLKMQRMAVCM